MLGSDKWMLFMIVKSKKCSLELVHSVISGHCCAHSHVLKHTMCGKGLLAILPSLSQSSSGFPLLSVFPCSPIIAMTGYNSVP